MTRWIMVLAFSAVTVLSGCASSREQVASQFIDPGEAVLRAAAAPNIGITGVFAVTVRGTGRAKAVHLNSEADYRDPRNLSIVIVPAVAAELEHDLGSPPEKALRGKRILVSGTAKRTRIDFVVHGRPTGKYYYQTHVRVTDASQIKIL